MSVYSYNTQGIFPSIIRAASEGLGSFSYVYEPSIIDRYNELDYGSLAFNPTPVTATETVAVDNLNATLTNTFLTNSGTGTGSTGGFNIGLGLGGDISINDLTYDPEFLTNYEIGINSKLKDSKLNIETVIFYSDREDQQVLISTQVDPTDPNTFSFLGPFASRYGLGSWLVHTAPSKSQILCRGSPLLPRWELQA